MSAVFLPTARSQQCRGPNQPRVWTCGHSTRSLDAFLKLLRAHGIQSLVDVRQFPGSRRYPHFNSAALGDALSQHGIRYQHLKGLGGRRKPAADSVNTGWKNVQFRAYADHMQTAEFEAALGDLEAEGRRCPTAIMCAEAVPWRCHRQLIADALVARGWEVLDILDETPARPHTLTPFAVIRAGRVTYPRGQLAPQGELFDLVDPDA